MNAEQYIVSAIDPHGNPAGYLGKGFPLFVPEAEAFRYNNLNAAAGGCALLYGHNAVFWESERRAAMNMRQRHRGWRFEAVPVEARS